MDATGSAVPGRVDYGDLEPVDRDRLRGLGVDPDYRNRFALGRNSVPITIVEFFRACHHFPIAFSEHAGRVTPCAVLGLAEGQNLFVDRRGGWREDSYQPAYLRRFPFFTAPFASADDDPRKPVFVDAAGLCRGAEPLFTDDGEATAAWREFERFLADYLSAERATLAFTARLRDLDLLEPFDARVYPRAAEPIRLRGLLRVDEDRLNALAAKSLRRLMQQGEMSRIYAHLISLDNFAKLLDLSGGR